MKIITSEQAKRLAKEQGFELVYNRYEHYWFLWDDETTENVDLGKSLFPTTDKLFNKYLEDFNKQVIEARTHQEAA